MDETTTPKTSLDTKWLYIGGILALIVVLGFGAQSLGLFGSGAASIQKNMDGTTTYSNNDGSVMAGPGTSMPENWPSDAPVPYSGATIIYSGTANPATGEAGSSVAYTTNASVQSVIDYYTDGLKTSGWTIEATADTAGIRVVSAKKDTRTFGVYVQDAGNGTTNVTAGVQL